jgi:hypothetical protein
MYEERINWMEWQETKGTLTGGEQRFQTKQSKIGRWLAHGVNIQFSSEEYLAP